MPKCGEKRITDVEAVTAAVPPVAEDDSMVVALPKPPQPLEPPLPEEPAPPIPEEPAPPKPTTHSVVEQPVSVVEAEKKGSKAGLIIALICVSIIAIAAVVVAFGFAAGLFGGSSEPSTTVDARDRDRNHEEDISTNIPYYITIHGEHFYTSLTSLDFYNWGLTNADIRQLRYMVNLENLDLGRNQISDISPLAGLTRLEYLWLDGNQISNISALAGLVNLMEVDLTGNPVADWMPVAHVPWVGGRDDPEPDNENGAWVYITIQGVEFSTSLTSLDLYGMGLTNADIIPLRYMVNLEGIDLGYNFISDITPLAGLTRLEYLWLDGNQISNISALAGLVNLVELDLTDNPVADWTPVAHVPWVGGRDTDDWDNGNAGTQSFTETPMDLGGRQITMLTLDHRNLWSYDRNDLERTPNETLRVIDIIRGIENEYNFIFEVYHRPAAGFLDMLFASWIAGDMPFDIIESSVTDFAVDALWSHELVMPMTHPAIADIIFRNNNQWSASTSLATVGDTVFGVGFRPLSSPTVIEHALIYNETLRQQLNLPNFYDMVRNGVWTWDAFETIATNIDAVGDGIFPIMYSWSASIMNPFIASNNGQMVTNTANGFQFVGYRNDNALDAMNFLQRLNNNGFFHPTRPDTAWHSVAINDEFARGEAVFAFAPYALLRNLTNQRPGYENNFVFGLLPTPVGPQGLGVNTVITSDVIYHIAADIRAPHEVAAILVAMANRTTLPSSWIVQDEAWYTFQTDGSVDMLELMLDNAVADISRVVAASRTAGVHGVTGSANLILHSQLTPIQAMQQMADQMAYWLDNINAAIR